MTVNEKWKKKIADALAEGERRGMIAGLREAAKEDRLQATTLTGNLSQKTWLQSAEFHERVADRLEKETP